MMAGNDEILKMDQALDEHTGEMIDATSKMVQICRAQAQQLMKIAMAFEGLGEMARAAADMNAEIARKAAELTGDIIKQEWGLLDDDEYDTDPDTDDTDDESDEDDCED